jgi:hypothetical protein
MDSGLDNQKATFLNINATTGFTPDAWQNGRIGTCIVARKDKKPLLLQHFEAVSMHIDLILDQFGDGGYQTASQWYSRPEFEEWYENYNREQLENGIWNEGVGSPYDL